MINRYAAGLLSLLFVVIQALRTTSSGAITWTDLVQLALVAIAGFSTYVLHLLPGKWQAGAKVASVLIAGVLSSIVPFVAQGFITPDQVITVVLTFVQALGAQIGVDLRLDADAKAAAATPTYQPDHMDYDNAEEVTSE